VGRLGRDRLTATEPTVAKAALLGCCPRCGKASLFSGYLNVASACGACGLDYAPFDVGDGPAVFVILIVGAIVAGSALFVEVKFEPPYWVHMVLWIPLVLILSLAMLRFMKSLLLVLQYKHKAGEGRLE
jgi:uncharacterized protein (DUF983 family)